MTNIGDYLETLNPRQREAVLHTEGPLLIVAGAGAGKTKTLTHRILHLIHQGVAPSEILAITFTNKAAREMKERLEKLLSGDSGLNRPVSMFERPFVSTFHSLGVHLLKENSRLLGLPRHFAIFDRADSRDAMREAVKEAGYDPKQYEPGRLLGAISKLKGDGVATPEGDMADSREFFQRILYRVWERYEAVLRREKALDFDDLLVRSVMLLREHPEVLTHYQKVWRYLLIDEYQDTNRVQYDLARLLAQEHRNICAVGDVDQSIYSWRGADFKNLMRFEKDYPDATTILLEQNYRSTKNILQAANAVIEKNTMRQDKRLFTENPIGERITLYGAFSEEDEAAFVAETAAQLIERGASPSEIACLYRANFQSRVLEEACLTRGVPYQVLGVRFFDRKEVKDVLSYLRAALNPEGLADFKRALSSPSRGVGKVGLLKIFGGQEQALPAGTREKVLQFKALLTRIAEKAATATPSQTLLYIIEESGLKASFEKGGEEDEERLGNLSEMVSVASKYDGFEPMQGIEQLLADAALESDQDRLDAKKDAVKLMTVHAAKGLEFDYVFVTGLEEGLFPMSREEDSTEEQEEERRLFYVALTRARHKLFLSYAAVRTVFGSQQVNIPSQFLNDIEEELFEQVENQDLGKGRRREKIIYLE